MTYPGQEPATPREEITTPTLVGAAAEAIGRIVGDVRQALAAVATLAAPSTTQTPEPAQVGSRDDRTSATLSEALVDASDDSTDMVPTPTGEQP
jgi:hypothetical protein